jgi:hypothetical protein
LHEPEFWLFGVKFSVLASLDLDHSVESLKLNLELPAESPSSACWFGSVSAASTTRVWQNHLNYPGSSALAITIKSTPTQTYFKWNNFWSVG